MHYILDPGEEMEFFYRRSQARRDVKFAPDAEELTSNAAQEAQRERNQAERLAASRLDGEEGTP